MTASCIFCRIAEGAIPSHRVYEDDRILAFLDISPIRPGHTQIIPKAHFETFDEMPADLAADIVALGQRLARAMKPLYGVARVGFAFIGTDVAHVHAHVVPMVAKTDLTSRRYIVEEEVTFRLPPHPPAEELQEAAATLHRLLYPA